MTTNNAKTSSIRDSLARLPLAAILYAGFVITFISITTFELMDLAERQQAVTAQADILSQLEGRTRSVAQKVDINGSMVSGSPFLDDPTVTVAGATLLQRVAGAVTHAGGNVLSSQVDLQGPQSKQGFISVTATCEFDQPALQGLLYDLESGMPFLYVDQLQVQAPAADGTPGEKLRVLISVSGQWQGAK
jgi:general secretion pathway protein M